MHVAEGGQQELRALRWRRALVGPTRSHASSKVNMGMPAHWLATCKAWRASPPATQAQCCKDIPMLSAAALGPRENPSRGCMAGSLQQVRRLGGPQGGRQPRPQGSVDTDAGRQPRSLEHCREPRSVCSGVRLQSHCCCNAAQQKQVERLQLRIC